MIKLVDLLKEVQGKPKAIILAGGTWSRKGLNFKKFRFIWFKNT